VPVDVFQNVESKVADGDIEKRADRLMSLIKSGNRKWLEGAFKRKLNPHVIDDILHYYKTAAKIGWREALVNFIRWRSSQLTACLKSCKPPIFCINSNRIYTDVNIARKYASSFRVKIVENSGHPVMLDAPEDFNRALAAVIREFTGSKFP
jgi:pimeloyl-ACP methyl ester carboxylesterase